MQSFLDKTADYILQHHKEHLQDLSVVLPNRRAALFLRKSLARKSKQPIWSPGFYSIEDFVFDLSGRQAIPVLDLLFELYKVHREIEKENAQTFDRFSGWGQLLLKDFNDIDLYLKDAQYVFRYLTEAKAISLWNLEPDNMTPMERDYLNFYGRLGKYYDYLNRNLAEANLAYQGMAYRMVAENPEKIAPESRPVIFAGFNALSPAEEKIFDYFEKRGQAKVLWDIDTYYFDDKKQEAGHFLRQQLQNVDRNKIDWITDDLLTDAKKVRIYGLSGDVSLAKMAGNILDEIAAGMPEKPAEETAMVLANEQLIIPLLYSLPERVETFNVTMSFPPRLSRVYELLMSAIDVYAVFYKADGSVAGDARYYHKSLINFLMHPLIQAYFEGRRQPALGQKIIRRIREYNISFVSPAEIPTLFELSAREMDLELIEMLRNKPGSVGEFLEKILSFLNILSSLKQSDMDAEFLVFYINMLRRLMDLIAQYPFINELQTLKKLFMSLSASQGIPFSGEPLSGVQIMGVLETRNLDFENLILLSANEGMLPKTKAYQSFILPDIKRELGLPLPADNDAVTAYHFYRLLQRAKNIHILYNTQHDRMGQGEMSRFVRQLEWEWRKKNPNIDWDHQLFHVPLSSDEYDTGIRFPKDDFAMQQLNRIAEKGFSPSTLNTYKSCSLKFYFQRILGMYNEDSVDEIMGVNILGTVIHLVLEEFYKPMIGRELTKSFLDDMAKNYPQKLREAFREIYKFGDIDHGFNRLLREVAAKYIDNFIEQERELLQGDAPCVIVGLELELERELKLEGPDGSRTIKLKGNADRVDRLGNRLRIIDYKTGKAKEKDLEVYKKENKQFVFDVEKLFEKGGDKAFQLMDYAWMYAPNALRDDDYEAAIIALKNHSRYLPLMIEDKETGISQEVLDAFEERLKVLFEEIFDDGLEFVQTDETENCQYCDYAFICGRSQDG